MRGAPGAWVDGGPRALTRRLRLVAGALLVVAAAACGGGPAPGPSGPPVASGEDMPTRDPLVSLSPLEDLCDRVARVRLEVTQMGRVPLRETNRGKVQGELEEVRAALQGLLAVDPGELEEVVATPLEAVVAGVRELGLAVEDFRTTPRLADGADHVERSMRQLERALRDLRRTAGCTA